MKKLKDLDDFYIVLHIFEVKTDEEFNYCNMPLRSEGSK